MYARDVGAIATPIGLVTITAEQDRLTGVTIGSAGTPIRSDNPVLQNALDQVKVWFAGRLQAFDLPLRAPSTHRGAVLREAIIDIPYGETASYGELARAIGSSPRALGQACARNPFPIIVPCHRVLASGGTLGAYSAGEGPTTKSWLLQAERRIRETLR